MISKNKIKLIKSLEHKKFRLKNNLFPAEGNKIVAELLKNGMEVTEIFATPDFLRSVSSYLHSRIQITETGKTDIEKASLLKSPQDALALCPVPQYDIAEVNPAENLVLCLDAIQDPGNLGAIVRLADWFGIQDIICSPDSADIFSPKAVQSSMGSFSRIKVHYGDLCDYLQEIHSKSNIYGAFLEGENIYEAELADTGIIIMGNEGKGIRPGLFPFIKTKFHIPSFSGNVFHAESLNVATATAIVCSEFRRRSAVIQNGTTK